MMLVRRTLMAKVIMKYGPSLRLFVIHSGRCDTIKNFNDEMRAIEFFPSLPLEPRLHTKDSLMITCHSQPLTFSTLHDHNDIIDD